MQELVVAMVGIWLNTSPVYFVIIIIIIYYYYLVIYITSDSYTQAHAHAHTQNKKKAMGGKHELVKSWIVRQNRFPFTN